MFEGGVYAHEHTGQKRTLGDHLCHSPFFSMETQSLTNIEFSKWTVTPSDPPDSSLQIQVTGGWCGTILNVLCGFWGFEFQSSSFYCTHRTISVAREQGMIVTIWKYTAYSLEESKFLPHKVWENHFSKFRLLGSDPYSILYGAVEDE